MSKAAIDQFTQCVALGKQICKYLYRIVHLKHCLIAQISRLTCDQSVSNMPSEVIFVQEVIVQFLSSQLQSGSSGSVFFERSSLK